MSGRRLEGLQVLVTGAWALISRDIVHLLVSEKALVTVADGDEYVLGRLQRDLGVCRTTANTALIDLFSDSEMRLFAANLHCLGKLPHLIVCCCEGDPCPAVLAASLLQPSLLLHALAHGGTGLQRAVANMNLVSLPDLLERARRRGRFDPGAWPGRVSIAGHAFSLRAGEGERARRGSGRSRSRAPVRRAPQPQHTRSAP